MKAGGGGCVRPPTPPWIRACYLITHSWTTGGGGSQAVHAASDRAYFNVPWSTSGL